MTLKVALDPPTALEWADGILLALSDRHIPHAALYAPIWRLNSAQSSAFNRVARGIPRPLYEMLYHRP